MERLKFKIIFFASGAVVFLLSFISLYVYSIYTFKKGFHNLELAHEFMESVLELRRYEKNVAFFADRQEIADIFIYLKKINSYLKTLALKQPDELPQINKLKKLLTQYQKEIEALKTGRIDTINVNKIRFLGHKILLLAESILDRRKAYINRFFQRILIVPAVVILFFGSVLIVVLLFISNRMLRQIKLVQEITERIADGDFSSLKIEDQKSVLGAPVIDAFNLMLKELEVREKDLLRTKKLASIGILVSGVAHELNNPLNNISLTAEMLMEEKDSLSPEEEREMLQDIVDETKRASAVVKNLLDFSRSKLSGEMERLDLAEVIYASLKLVKNQLLLSKVELKVEIEPDLPKITGNADSLKQVFVNLFTNALQAMPKGGFLRIGLKQVELNNKNYLEVQVQDSGQGMSADVLEKIFDPFFSTKPVGQGTGLGLSIVYGIVKKHQGKIKVKSKPNQGTTFFVYFPVAEDANGH